MGYCLKKLEYFLAKHTVPTFRDKPSVVILNFYDTMCILFISFVSIIIRFWDFFNPYHRVSLEIPNQFFTKNQINFQSCSFSQPLGNILYSFFATVCHNDDGYASNNDYSNFSTNFSSQNSLNYLNDDDQITLRAISLLFSSFVPPLLYISMKLASYSRICSFLSGFIIIFDTSMLFEGKFCHPSGFIHFFTAVSLCFMTYWFSMFRNNEKWNKYMKYSSIMIGLTVSVKSSSYFLIFIVYFHEFIYLFIEHNNKLSLILLKSVLKRYRIFTFPVISIHLFFCLIQFLLTFSKEFQFNFDNFQQFSNNNLCSFTIFRLILTNCVNLQSEQFSNHKSNSNSPINWIFINNLDGNIWMNCDSSQNCERVIYIGNIFIYFFAIFGVILVILFKWNRKYFRSSTFYLGYIFSFLPYLFLSIFSNFNLSSSNYLIPLMFGVACFGISIDITVNRFTKGFLTIIAIAFAILGFKIWSPFVLAKKLNKSELHSKILFDSWEDEFKINFGPNISNAWQL